MKISRCLEGLGSGGGVHIPLTPGRSDVMSWSNKNKRCMRVDESWQARVGMRVFSTLMSWSNENKSCMKLSKWKMLVETACFQNKGSKLKKRQFHYHLSNKSCTRVDESWQARFCMRIFSTPGQTLVCKRVDKREFVWEFSQFPCPDQPCAQNRRRIWSINKRFDINYVI